METEALRRAVEILGSQDALARAIGVHQTMISYWLRKQRRLPAERVIAICKATDGKIRRWELRPDIWPPRKAA